MRRTRCCLFAGLLFIVATASAALADVVTPTEDVTTGVVVRESASSQSALLGVIRPNEQAVLLGSVPNWHRVELPNGVQGFVSKRWTRVLSSGGPAAASPSFTIDTVDVGTGLGVFVRGSDFSLVYDAGSNDDDAKGPGNRMVAFIRKATPATSVIDHVILSHPHTDHVELLPDLFSTFQINAVWDSGRLHDICGYRAFLTAIRDEPGVKYHNALQDFGTKEYAFAAKRCYGVQLPAESIPVKLDSRISAGTVIPLGQGASMTILNADAAKYSSPNANSVVVRLDLGSTRVLLMGDAEAGGRDAPANAPKPSSIEGRLLACCANDLPARILITGHHGSMTSSRRAFLNAVGASTFVVSSGPTVYGDVVLPDQAVVTELQSRGQVFRTDTDDTACATNPTKIGPVNDGRAGGCDNVRITVSDSTPMSVQMWRGLN
jgi:beta-lactamase superfamily II metal-dependent hydrolase